MENWFLLAFFAYGSYSISTSIDKHLMKDGHSVVLTGLLKCLFNALILSLAGIFFLGLSFDAAWLPYAVGLGLLLAASFVLYYSSLKLGDVSEVVPYTQSSQVLLVFTFAVLFLSEKVSLSNIFGVLLVSGGIFLVLGKGNIMKQGKVGRAIVPATAMVFVDVMYFIFAKLLLASAPPLSMAIAMYFSVAAFLAVYIIATRPRIGHSEMLAKKLSAVVPASVFGSAGTLMLFTALSLGNASRVYPIAGTQLVYVLLISAIFLKEKLTMHKAGAIALIFVGTWLVSG